MPLARTTAWLQPVLSRLPATIRAVYVECSDVYTPAMEHVVCFNAFGFESLGGGHFDASKPEHIGELGDFTWEPSDECRFRADDHPRVNWMALLQEAARSPGVLTLATERNIQFVVGEHDGNVVVVR